ncbi:hypothetical protein TBLA_0I00360 [Henningerozyma blattae CBS 6284]|uniref:Uncharacterized protein n=1 Tax=Henningerozyma blattae (strain ATCC 34711 / CBS 6284 / DSM 70876 / NBRC 10599 / NRRL Y-10934 / UCD 77-7) TaxID=1071380 RepID=I2H8J7_HENB6|nr:hypothetical protein TBLA_0I00360 [Tetrapisispora blattae CBS 6284]CCH62699.1 hypothetical protein TBLA_0I00360 [Tetrapisispora blattae CBS 6284]
MSFIRSTSTNTGTTTMTNGKDLENDITISNPAEDSISDIAFSPQQDFMFSASSWDNKVRIWDVQNGVVQGRAQYEHSAPVLTTRWSGDGTKVASGGCDNVVKLYDVTSGQSQQIGVHQAPVKSLRFVPCGPGNTELIVTGSWDKTIKYWDMRQPQPVSTVMMPERVYSMDNKQQLLIVATAERHICIINLANPQVLFKTVMSPLKWQTRVVSCYNQGDGYAIGSVEGRCALRYIDDVQQKDQGFSFKCHRQASQNRAIGMQSQSIVSTVNTIACHPVYSSFVTGGSDGSFHFWDKDNRHRLKGFPAQSGSISVVNFNRNGTVLAYAISNDWHQGHMGNRPDYPNIIKLHPTTDYEVKGRKKNER